MLFFLLKKIFPSSQVYLLQTSDKNPHLVLSVVVFKILLSRNCVMFQCTTFEIVQVKANKEIEVNVTGFIREVIKSTKKDCREPV